MNKVPDRKKASAGRVKTTGRPKEKVKDKIDFRQLEFLCRKGFIDRELGEFFGVTERTINNWKKDEEFLSVLKEAKAEADGEVVRSLYERACGYSHPEERLMTVSLGGNAGSEVERHETVKHYPPDSTAIIFWLKNRQPENWQDKQELHHSGDITVEKITKITNGKAK